MSDILGLLGLIPQKLDEANRYITDTIPSMMGKYINEHLSPENQQRVQQGIGALRAFDEATTPHARYNGREFPMNEDTPFDNPLISMAGVGPVGMPGKMMKGMPSSTSKLKTILSQAQDELAQVVEGYHPMSGNVGYENGLRNYIKSIEKQLNPFNAYDTTSPQAIINATKTGGGYSVDLNTGQIPADGYMVGQFPNEASRTQVLNSLDEMTPENVMRFIRQNRDVLGQQDMHMGTWADDAGKVYLDISKRYGPDMAKDAVTDAQRTGQKAIFNMVDFSEIPESDYSKYLKFLIPGMIGGGAAYQNNQ